MAACYANLCYKLSLNVLTINDKIIIGDGPKELQY